MASTRLVANGTLHSATGSIFSIDGKPLSLYRHQAQAVAKAATRQSFVVTTGTGSGKSPKWHPHLTLHGRTG
jgi:hypothetical protein